MKKQKLPKSDSVRRLAHFWDTHDVTDLEDQLEEVKEPIFKRQTVIPVSLESSEAKALKKIAKTKGIADTALIREWVIEKIHSG